MDKIEAFNKDPNWVTDIDTTRGRSVSYEDTNFIVGDSPVVLDINTDLSRNARDGYVICDSGSFSVEISDNGTDYGGIHTVKIGEILRLKGVDMDSVRITWIENASYRCFFI